MSDLERDKVRLAGAINLLGHTGTRQVQLRYSDDEEPVVWFAVAIYEDTKKWDVAAAAGPLRAVERLCEQLLDGGTCLRCNRPSGFDGDPYGVGPFDTIVCFFRWDPEANDYRRGCEVHPNGPPASPVTPA